MQVTGPRRRAALPACAALVPTLVLAGCIGQTQREVEGRLDAVADLEVVGMTTGGIMPVVAEEIDVIVRISPDADLREMRREICAATVTESGPSATATVRDVDVLQQTGTVDSLLGVPVCDQDLVEQAVLLRDTYGPRSTSGVLRVTSDGSGSLEVVLRVASVGPEVLRVLATAAADAGSGAADVSGISVIDAEDRVWRVRPGADPAGVVGLHALASAGILPTRADMDADGIWYAVDADQVDRAGEVVAQEPGLAYAAVSDQDRPWGWAAPSPTLVPAPSPTSTP